MKCRRAFDVDLAAVLRGESADADFLAHHPACPDCATEVGVWRELDAMLRTGGPTDDAHPAPATLLALVEAPATLGAEARGAVERHVAACRVCADELQALRALEPATVTDARVAPTPLRPSARTDASSTTPGRLARVLWHPAFAYALVAVLLVPVVRAQLPQVESRSAAPAESDASRLAAPRERAAEAEESEHGAAPGLSERAAGRAFSERFAAPAPPALLDERSRDTAGAAAPRPQLEARAPAAAGVPAAKARRADGDDAPARVAQAAPPAAPATTPVQIEIRDPAAARSAFGAYERQRAESRIPRGELPRFLQVGPQGSPTFAADTGGRRVELRVIPPADLAAGPVDVTVRGRTGQADVHVRVTDRADAIVVGIPPGWLVPGAYSVVLQPVDAAGSANARPTVLGFSVRAPDAPGQ